MAINTTILIISFLKVIFILIGASVTIWVLIPIFKKLTASSINDADGTKSIISLLIAYVILAALEALVSIVLQISAAATYVSPIQNAFSLFDIFFNYIKWILLVLIGIFAFKYIRTPQPSK